MKVSACERHSSRPNWAIIASVSAVYPASTMNSVEGSPWLSASSSQMKNENPIAAGHCPSRSGYSDGSHGVIPSRRTTHAPMSYSVENGSSQCQIGKSSAETSAIPTHPYTHRKSVATLAELDPPTMPCAMIQAQPNRPIARRLYRSQAGGSPEGPSSVGSSTRTSRRMTNANDRATVMAAPAR